MTAPTVALEELAQCAAGAHTNLTKDEPANERADHADDHVREPAEAASLHQQAGQPASHETDQEKPDNVHGLFLRGECTNY